MESAGPQISKAYLDAMKSLQDNLRNLKTEHRSLRLEYETVSKENSMLSADKGQLLEQLHRSQTHSVGRWGSESFEQLQLGERSQLVARIYEL
jgi:regulator of replication initiation timing